jgi:hypothetical protein
MADQKSAQATAAAAPDTNYNRTILTRASGDRGFDREDVAESSPTEALLHRGDLAWQERPAPPNLTASFNATGVVLDGAPILPYTEALDLNEPHKKDTKQTHEDLLKGQQDPGNDGLSNGRMRRHITHQAAVSANQKKGRTVMDDILMQQVLDQIDENLERMRKLREQYDNIQRNMREHEDWLLKQAQEILSPEDYERLKNDREDLLETTIERLESMEEEDRPVWYPEWRARRDELEEQSKHTRAEIDRIADETRELANQTSDANIVEIVNEAVKSQVPDNGQDISAAEVEDLFGDSEPASELTQQEPAEMNAGVSEITVLQKMDVHENAEAFLNRFIADQNAEKLDVAVVDQNQAPGISAPFDMRESFRLAASGEALNIGSENDLSPQDVTTSPVQKLGHNLG